MESPRPQCFTDEKTIELQVKRETDFHTWMKSVWINALFSRPVMTTGKVSLNLYGKKGENIRMEYYQLYLNKNSQANIR